MELLDTRWVRPVSAALAVFALVLAFGLVVARQVEAGHARRSAFAAHDVASWRCQALHGREPRDACLLELTKP